MLLIIDGNNVAWAGFYAVGRSMGLEDPERRVRAALIGLTQSVLGMVARGGEPPSEGGGRTLPPGTVRRVAVAFDEGRPWRRRSVFPAYQTGREADPNFIANEPAVLAGIDAFIVMALESLPIAILRGVNTEADDLIARVAIQAEGPVRIASTDRDFLQLVSPSISIFSPVKRVVISATNFAEHAAPRDAGGIPASFPRERYLDYRAASGDSSDDLPGIPGVGSLTAARMLAAHELDAYLGDPSLVAAALGRRNVKVEGAIRDGVARAVVDRNRALMDLRRAAAAYASLDGFVRYGRWDETSFRAWMAEERMPLLDLGATVDAFNAVDDPSGTLNGTGD